MRGLILILALSAAAACGDNTTKPSTPDGGVDAPPSPPRLTGCLERPGVLPVAPSGQLPCDLVPPGLTL